MAYEFKLPDLGEGLTEGEIARWLVEVGQEIAEDDPLVEIQTDKTTVEIPSPAGGVVSGILAAEGDVVPVGTVIVVIGGDGAAGPPEPKDEEQPRADPAQQQRAAGEGVTVTRSLSASRPSAPRDGRVRATPLVRRVAQELGVDLEAVAPSGPGGRVTEEDVRAAAAPSRPGSGPEEAAKKGGGRSEPLRGVRRLIAEQMTRAHAVPAVTWVEEADFTGVDLGTVVARTVKAVADTLADYPELNARFEGDSIAYLDRYDVGVAVQTEQGLVVPVVRGCDAKGVDEIDAELRRLAEDARGGKLKPEELRDSTFTVTSAGKLAGLLVTPLINHPEVAILGLHRIEERAVVRDGEIAIRRIGNVSVTFDHRVVDGARAAEFGLAVIRRLEQPSP